MPPNYGNIVKLGKPWQGGYYYRNIEDFLEWQPATYYVVYVVILRSVYNITRKMYHETR